MNSVFASIHTNSSGEDISKPKIFLKISYQELALVHKTQELTSDENIYQSKKMYHTVIDILCVKLRSTGKSMKD